MSLNFYTELESFTTFEDFTMAGKYQPMPDDWLVVVADIRNSTEAIDKGLYKEVNLIGAACITQSIQVVDIQDLPFVFGGDGAMLCIPPSEAAAVTGQLAGLQKLGRDNFGLELRVALIPLQDLRDRRADVLVAKLEITAGKCIALFRGGGLAMADRLAKEEYARYGIPPATTALDNLNGLSCRWSPVPSRKGKVISLLVMARDTQTSDTRAMEVYREVVNQFRAILGRELSKANPVLGNLVNYKTVAQALRDEVKYHKSWFSRSFLIRIADILLAVPMFRHGINPIAPKLNAKNYRDAISGHSDFRKFDDTLRLILDCSHDELVRLQSLLDEGYRAGHFYYGLYASDEALMTCFVETTRQGGHLHFIDGGDGGLAMAARQMKMQIKAYVTE